MKLHIEISLDDDAIQNNPVAELSKILDSVAWKFRHGYMAPEEPCYRLLWDSNGNQVGFAAVSEENGDGQ